MGSDGGGACKQACQTKKFQPMHLSYRAVAVDQVQLDLALHARLPLDTLSLAASSPGITSQPPPWRHIHAQMRPAKGMGRVTPFGTLICTLNSPFPCGTQTRQLTFMSTGPAAITRCSSGRIPKSLPRMHPSELCVPSPSPSTFPLLSSRPPLRIHPPTQHIHLHN